MRNEGKKEFILNDCARDALWVNAEIHSIFAFFFFHFQFLIAACLSNLFSCNWTICMHSIGFEPYIMLPILVESRGRTLRRSIERWFFARWIFVIQIEMTSLMIALSNSIQLFLLPIFVSLSILKLFHMTMKNHCARPFRSLIKWFDLINFILKLLQKNRLHSNQRFQPAFIFNC